METVYKHVHYANHASKFRPDVMNSAFQVPRVIADAARTALYTSHIDRIRERAQSRLRQYLDEIADTTIDGTNNRSVLQVFLDEMELRKVPQRAVHPEAFGLLELIVDKNPSQLRQLQFLTNADNGIVYVRSPFTNGFAIHSPSVLEDLHKLLCRAPGPTIWDVIMQIPPLPTIAAIPETFPGDAVARNGMPLSAEGRRAVADDIHRSVHPDLVTQDTYTRRFLRHVFTGRRCDEAPFNKDVFNEIALRLLAWNETFVLPTRWLHELVMARTECPVPVGAVAHFLTNDHQRKLDRHDTPELSTYFQLFQRVRHPQYDTDQTLVQLVMDTTQIQVLHLVLYRILNAMDIDAQWKEEVRRVWTQTFPDNQLGIEDVGATDVTLEGTELPLYEFLSKTYDEKTAQSHPSVFALLFDRLQFWFYEGSPKQEATIRQLNQLFATIRHFCPQALRATQRLADNVPVNLFQSALNVRMYRDASLLVQQLDSVDDQDVLNFGSGLLAAPLNVEEDRTVRADLAREIVERANPISALWQLHYTLACALDSGNLHTALAIVMAAHERHLWFSIKHVLHTKYFDSLPVVLGRLYQHHNTYVHEFEEATDFRHFGAALGIVNDMADDMAHMSLEPDDQARVRFPWLVHVFYPFTSEIPLRELVKGRYWTLLDWLIRGWPDRIRPHFLSDTDVHYNESTPSLLLYDVIDVDPREVKRNSQYIALLQTLLWPAQAKTADVTLADEPRTITTSFHHAAIQRGNTEALTHLLPLYEPWKMDRALVKASLAHREDTPVNPCTYLCMQYPRFPVRAWRRLCNAYRPYFFHSDVFHIDMSATAHRSVFIEQVFQHIITDPAIRDQLVALETAGQLGSDASLRGTFQAQYRRVVVEMPLHSTIGFFQYLLLEVFQAPTTSRVWNKNTISSLFSFWLRPPRPEPEHCHRIVQSNDASGIPTLYELCLEEYLKPNGSPHVFCCLDIMNQLGETLWQLGYPWVFLRTYRDLNHTSALLDTYKSAVIRDSRTGAAVFREIIDLDVRTRTRTLEEHFRAQFDMGHWERVRKMQEWFGIALDQTILTAAAQTPMSLHQRDFETVHDWIQASKPNELVFEATVEFAESKQFAPFLYAANKHRFQGRQPRRMLRHFMRNVPMLLHLASFPGWQLPFLREVKRQMKLFLEEYRDFDVADATALLTVLFKTTLDIYFAKTDLDITTKDRSIKTLFTRQERTPLRIRAAVHDDMESLETFRSLLDTMVTVVEAKPVARVPSVAVDVRIVRSWLNAMARPSLKPTMETSAELRVSLVGEKSE